MKYRKNLVTYSSMLTVLQVLLRARVLGPWPRAADRPVQYTPWYPTTLSCASSRKMRSSRMCLAPWTLFFFSLSAPRNRLMQGRRKKCSRLCPTVLRSPKVSELDRLSDTVVLVLSVNETLCFAPHPLAHCFYRLQRCPNGVGPAGVGCTARRSRDGASGPPASSPPRARRWAAGRRPRKARRASLYVFSHY